MRSIIKINLKFIVLIMTGSLAWTLTMFKSGLVYKYGMGFWGPNGHDGIWHIALIESLAKGTLEMPVFAGQNIKNYHIGFDLLLALIHKVTHIPVINLYFQIVPLVFAIFIGFLVYKFVLIWRRSEIQAFWATFFIYFSGSLGWFVTLMRNEGIGGESLFWAQQSLSTPVNPPFALSLIFIFAAFIYLLNNQKKRSFYPNLLTAVIFGLLVQIKIYGAILILGALLIGGVWNIIRARNYNLFYIFIITLIISVILILPLFDLRTRTLIFRPFWFLESMVATTDRFYWPKMASAMANYKLSGNIFKGLAAYSFVFLIFLIGNMGIRIISIPWLIRSARTIKKLDYITVMIFSVVSFGIILPMFFIQTGNSWNTIQFFYYSLIFLSLLSGIAMGEYLEKTDFSAIRSTAFIRVKVYVLIGSVIMISVFTVISTLRHYLPSRPPAMIPTMELKALRFLKDSPDGVVVAIPYDKDLADKAITNPPRPLYLYESTAYISAMTGKRVFLEDEVNLDITGYDWRRRRDEVQGNLNNIMYLKDLGITYIYVPDEKNFIHKDEMRSLNIYNKDGIAIYKI